MAVIKLDMKIIMEDILIMVMQMVEEEEESINTKKEVVYFKMIVKSFKVQFIIIFG